MDPSSRCWEPEQRTDKLLPQSKLSDLLDEVIIITDFIGSRHSDCVGSVCGESHGPRGLSIFPADCSHVVAECTAEYVVAD